MKARIFKPEIISILLISFILTYILIIEPVIGMADNGDFGRIMNSAGLDYLSPVDRDSYFGYFNREYKVTSLLTSGGDYFSTQIVPILLAKVISRVTTFNANTFDIRFLAFVYSCLLLLSIYLLIRYSNHKSALASWILAGILVLVFTDVGYISYFNSLYGEAVSFLSLLLTAALAICVIRQKNPGLPALIGFFISAILLTGAKAQNVPIGIILTIFGFRLLHLRKDMIWKKTVFFFCAVLLLTTFKCYTSVPDRIKICNKYQSVFYGILKDSPNPERDLEELGLDIELSVLAGTDFFMQEYPIDIKDPKVLKELNDKISPLKIAAFYIKHPSRYIKKLQITSENGFTLLHGYGNYEKGKGKKFGETAGLFKMWSEFKKDVLPHSLLFTAIFFAACLAVLMIYYIKSMSSLNDRLYIEVFLFVWLSGIIQFLVPILGDGEADLGRHLFLFNACFDILFIASATWISGITVKYTTKLINRVALAGNTP